MNGKAQTWQQLVQERQQNLFIGRQREQELFRLNFIYQVPEYVIFVIYGPTGIGKSTLLNRYRVTAEEHGATTVRVNMEQAAHISEQTILQTMSHLARQLAAANTLLTTFDERYRQYTECMRVLAEDPHTPAGIFDLVGQLAQTEETLSEAWDTYLDEKLLTPDQIALINTPVEILTQAFLQDLTAWATIRRIILYFDDWEHLAPHMNTWLRDMLTSNTLNTNVWLVIASETPLDESWELFRPVTVSLSLQTFTAEETHIYLSAKGITEGEHVSNIWTYAKGMPILVDLLSSTEKVHTSVLAANPVDRYLKWLDEPWLRETALYCATARRLDSEIVKATIGGENTTTLFEWLTQTPLVIQKTDYWAYHPALRQPMLQLAQKQAPEAFRTAHANLYTYYKNRLADPQDEVSYRDAQWRQDKVESIYHGLSSGNHEAEGEGLETFLLALHTYYPLAKAVLITWEQAAVEQQRPSDITDWAQTLRAGWRALEEQDWSSVQEFCNIVSQQAAISPAAQQALHTLYEIAEMHLATAQALPVKEEEAPTQILAEVEPSKPSELERVPDVVPSSGSPQAELSPDVSAQVPDTMPNDAPSAEIQVEKVKQDDAVAPENEERALSFATTVPPSPDMPQVQADKDKNKQEQALELEKKPAVFEAVSLETEKEAGEEEEERLEEHEEDSAGDVKEDDEETVVTQEPGKPVAEVTTPSGHAQITPDAGEVLGADDYIKRATVYLRMGEYEKAIRDYTQAIDIDADNIVAYYNRAIAYTQIRGCDHALEDYGKVITLNPRYAPAYRNRGLIYARQRNYKCAIEDYTQAIALAPEDATAYNNRANVYFNLEQYAQAIADYDLAIQYNPEYVAAYLNRGLCYASLEEFQKAIADYNQVILLKPESATAYNYQGQAYARLEQYALALKSYDKALEIHPAYSTAYNNRGLALVKQKEYAQAIEAYQKAIAINPQYATAYYNAACAAALIADAREARVWLEKAIALYPQYQLMAKQDSDFDAVRRDLKFRKLMEESP